MDIGLSLLILLLAVIISVVLTLRYTARSHNTSERLAGLTKSAAETIARTQAELSGQLKQMAASQEAGQNSMSERLQAQERAVTKKLEERLGDVSRRVGDKLQKTSEKTAETFNSLHERLAVIDAAQKNITDLSQEMVGLQGILSNKQARGAFGQIRMEDLVSDTLPPSAFSFQQKLSNGKIVDCLIKLPNPPGSIGIDSKFPMENYESMVSAEDKPTRKKLAKAFAADVTKHIRDIAEKYILPDETAEQAMMFLPSESIYTEIHSSFPDVVMEGFRRKVYIVSPTTLWATLNTVRAILKDVHMREQANVILAEVGAMLLDVERLDERIDKLARHFRQSTDDINQIRISADKIVRRGDRIEQIQLGENNGNVLEDLPSPTKVQPKLESR